MSATFDVSHDARRNHEPRAAPRWLPWLIGALGLALDVAAWWPGQMSFDSAYAWWQARGGVSTDIVPPMLVLAWRAADAVYAGPAPLFALHLVMFWSGLALLARAARWSSTAATFAMLGVAFNPVTWLLRAHVWTDVGLFSALVLVCGFLATATCRRTRGWLIAAIPPLLYAGALRHNALPALLPLAAWLAWAALRTEGPTGRMLPRRSSLIAGTLAVLVGVLAFGRLVDASAQRRVPLWPSLAQWDLAALSIGTQQMLLPDFMIGAGLSVDELAQAFRPWSNTPMLQNTTHGMRDPFTGDYSAGELAALRTAWFDGVIDHPRAWLGHRWRLTRALFGTHAEDWPVELLYVDAEIGYGDNPPVAGNAGGLHRSLMRVAQSLRATPLLAAWPILLIGLLALPRAWRDRFASHGAVALVLMASAWAYALPLTVFAPAAELRYLGWPCLASLLAACSAWLRPRLSAR